MTWHALADRLTDWTLGRLVNRVDAWGGYWRDDDGGTHPTTRPRPDHRGRRSLRPSHLRRHFAASGTCDVVGLHAISPANTCRWCAWDIDHHEGGTDPADAFRAALSLWFLLGDRGHEPLLERSGGGFHVWLLFSEPVPSADAWHLANRTADEVAGDGHQATIERLPRQRDLTGCKLGNWLRLPGLHHKRGTWSAIWDGNQWADGADAARWMLACRPSLSSLIPPAPPPRKPRTFTRAELPVSGDELDRRISRYVSRVPNGTEGTGRDNRAFNLARWLISLGLSDADALFWMARWDEGNSPQKGPARLSEILKNAHTYSSRAVTG